MRRRLLNLEKIGVYRLANKILLLQVCTIYFNSYLFLVDAGVLACTSAVAGGAALNSIMLG
jgi:hypothetical protein